MKHGQIRQDVRNKRLVLLKKDNASMYLDESLFTTWRVEDVLSGEIYWLNDEQLGVEVYNEMEVLAWASI